MLKEKAFAAHHPTIDVITQLDASVLGEKTYEGGCKLFLKCFNDKVHVDVA